MTNKIAILAIAAALSACGGPPQPPPSKLIKPASSLMVAPGALPDLMEGEDIGQHVVQVRRMYGREAGKLRRLQRYVRTVTK